MSRPAPSFVEATLATYRFAMLRTVRGRRLPIALVATGLLVFAVVLGRKLGDQASTDAWNGALRFGLLGFLGYLLPFLFHASSFSEEHEDRTLAFLLVRPVPRGALLFGKYLAGITATLGIGLPTVAALYVASFAGYFQLGEPELLGKACLATALLMIGHGAIASAWSTIVPEHSTAASVVHFALGELMPLQLPAVLPLVSMHQHAIDVAGLAREGSFASSIPELPIGASCGAVVAYAVFFFTLAAMFAGSREYRFTKS